MAHHILRRFVLVVGFILLTALFLLVLTLNAMKIPSTGSASLPEGPYLVKDIMLDEANSYPAPVIPAGDKVYFFAYDDQGRNLWISDGTEAGTHQVKDLNELTGAVPDSPQPTPYPTPIHGYDYPEAIDDQLFFVNDDGIHGKELWVSDGSSVGTLMVKDIYTGAVNYYAPSLLTNVNGRLFFRGREDIHGADLWTSDGTMTNTNMVKDIEWVDYLGIVNMNGKAYFSGGDVDHGAELWTSDGSEEGTVMVKDLNPDSASSSPYLFHATDTHVFFLANHPDYGFGLLWQSDGTITGTTLVQNITGTTFAIGTPNLRVATNNRFFFTAVNSSNKRVLWVTDGTITGTHFVKDVAPYSGQAVGDRLFFFASKGGYGSELWVSDGTDEGTYMVKDINLGGSHSSCSVYDAMANLNGMLFFVANDGEHGCELWMSDGTAAGTVLVQDINLGLLSSRPQYFGATNKTLFFTADDGTHGTELWSLGNMAPKAKDDTAVTRMNHPVSIPVTLNDSDVNLDTFTISTVDDPAFGEATIDGESISYTPDDGFIGSDSFTYTVQESGEGLTAVAQVNVIVTGTRTYLPIVLHQTGDR